MVSGPIYGHPRLPTPPEPPSDGPLPDPPEVSYEPELPDWIPPPPPPPSVAAGRVDLEETDRPPTKVQITTVGSGSVLPLVYGRVHIAPKVGMPFFQEGNSYRLRAVMFWCEGPIESITVLRDGNSYLGGLNEGLGGSYLGTQTTVDSFLESELGYPDAHENVAYSIMNWGQDSAPDDMTGIVEGLKVYDPRDDSTSGVPNSSHPSYGGLQRPDNPSTWKYYIADDWVPGTNPAICLGNFHQRYRSTYEQIDWASVAACADNCDVDISEDEIPVKRSEFGVVIDKRKSYDSYFKMLKEYALVRHHYYDGDTLVLVPDKDSSVVAELDESDIIAGSLNLQYSDSQDVPDQVVVRYSNISSAVAEIGAEYGGMDWVTAEEIAQTPAPDGGAKNIQIVPMSGWQSHQAAYRYAVRRYNRLNLINLGGSFKAFDEAIRYVPGDVISITHSRGLAGALFVVTEIKTVDLARYEVSIEEYQPNIWSDEIQDGDALPVIRVPSPLQFPTVTFPKLFGEFPLDENGDPYDTPRFGWEEKLWKDESGRWHTVFEVSFNGGDWPHTGGFRYQFVRAGSSQLLDEGTVLYRGDTVHKVVSPPSSQGELWHFRVWVNNINGQHDPDVYAEILTLKGFGKQIAPLEIPAGSLTCLEAGQFVSLTWGASGDSDLAGYNVKRIDATTYETILAANPTTGAVLAWESSNAATLATRVDAEHVLLGLQPVGDWYYGVRAIDQVGNVSPTPRWVFQEVTAEGAGSIAVRRLLPYRNFMTSSYDMTDTSADAWNYEPYNPPAITVDQVGLFGFANTASLVTADNGISDPPEYRGTSHALAEHPRFLCARFFIRQRVAEDYNLQMYLNGFDSTDPSGYTYTIIYWQFNQSDGSYSFTPASGHTTNVSTDYDVREATHAGNVWYEITVSIRVPQISGIVYDKVTSIIRKNPKDYSTRSWVIGNLELYTDRETKDIAGTPPQIVPGTSGFNENISFDDIPGKGTVAYVDVGDSWEDRFGTQTSAWPASEAEPWIHNLSTTGTYTITAAEWDTGSNRFGNWYWAPENVTEYGGGTVTKQAQMATESAWPTYTNYSGTSQALDARFIRPRITMTSADVDEAFSVTFPITTSYQGKVVKDVVNVTVSATGGTSFSWNETFASTPRWWVVSNAASGTILAVGENVTATGGTVYLFDMASSGAETTGSATVYGEGI